MTIYLDMDGTIANLYSVENWLDQLRAESTLPYQIARPLCDMERLNAKLSQLQCLGFRVGVLSWCSKNGTKEYNAQVRQAKRAWLHRYLPYFKFDEIHIVTYGTPKEKVANDDGWLIDDEAPNREKWNAKRGDSYDPTEKDIFEILDEISSFI